jgi:PAS domain S-box-containing protein
MTPDARHSSMDQPHPEGARDPASRQPPADELARAFEHAAIGLALIDDDARFVRVNAACGAILGRAPASLAGVGYWEVTHPADLPADLPHVQRLLAGDLARVAAVRRFLRADGAEVLCSISIARLPVVGSAPRRFVASLQEVPAARASGELRQVSAAVAGDADTELRAARRARDEAEAGRRRAEVARASAEEARERAEEANRVKSEFLARMSHELRTPLNAIGGYAELLQLGIPEPAPEPARQYIGRIQENQRHLQSMLDQLLGFARIEAGRVEYDVADVIVHDALRAVGSAVVPQAAKRGVAYRYERADASLVARADADKLGHILRNLVGNAIKYTEAGGSVALSAAAGRGAAVGHPATDVVLIDVRDSGRGIPPDQLEAIFEPFVQVGDARQRRTGVGLGLAISREYARGMGGDLTVASAPGQGSVFTVILPRVLPVVVRDR